MKTNLHLFLTIIELKKPMRGDECLVSLLGTSSHGWREGKRTEHKTYSGKKDQVQRWQESTRREPSWMMMSQNIPSPNNAEQGITFPMPVFRGIRLRHGTIQLVQKKKTKHLHKQSGGQVWIKIMCSSKFCSSTLSFGKVISSSLHSHTSASFILPVSTSVLWELRACTM